MNTGHVMRSSAVMAAGTAVSRVLGFVRAAVLLAAVAPSVNPTTGVNGRASADAFSVANTVPNALYILLAGGILNAILVPQITRAARRGDGGQEYIDRLLTTAITVLFVVTVAFTAAAPLLIRLYSTDRWTPQETALATAFALWCLPQVFWYGVYTLLGQVLNARGSFGPFMWAPVVNNIVAIAGLMVFIAVKGAGEQSLSSWTPATVGLLSGTATLGVVAQAVVLIPAMRRAGVGFRIRWGLRGFGLRTAGRVAGWTFAAVVVQQLGFIIISRVTTAAGQQVSQAPGAPSTGKVIYDYAFLLFMLPHSLVAVSLVTALFTRMSVAAADHRIDDVRADLSLGLRLTGLATVLSAGTFLALGPDLSQALFAGSTTAVTNGIAYVAMAMLVGLVPFSAQYLFQRVFYAFENAKTPFLVQVPIVLIWSAGNLLSLRLLSGEYIVIGVGISMTLANLAGAGLSAWLLHRHLGGIDGRRVASTHLKYVIAVGVGGAVAVVISRTLHLTLGDGRLTSLLASVLGGAAIMVIYWAGLSRMGVTELNDMLAPLLRRRHQAKV
jgi:putative peptidoglycan lipid II flippase